MRLDRFTIKAQEGVTGAQRIATENDNQEITPEHLLAALLGQDEGIVVPILKKVGADPEPIRRDLAAAIEKIPKVYGASEAGGYMSQDLKRAIDSAFKEMERLRDEFVSTEHLLVGIVDIGSKAGEILADHGVTKDNVYKALVEIRGTQRVTDQAPEDKYQALQRFARDLTDLARRK